MHSYDYSLQRIIAYIKQHTSKSVTLAATCYTHLIKVTPQTYYIT